MASAPAYEPENRDSGLRSYEGTLGAKHSISDSEVEAFSGFLNDALSEDNLVADLLPLDRRDATAFISAFADGRLLTSLVNIIRPGTVDTSAYANYKGATRQHATRVYECLNRALEGASRIPGVHLTNVGAVDFVNGKAVIILGTVWQLIFARMLDLTSLRHHPETIRLLKDDESLDDFYRRPREEVLLRWFNFQLEAADCSLRVANFSADLKDCRAYEILLRQLDQDGKAGVAAILEDGVGGNGNGFTGPAAAVIAAARAVGVDEVLTLPRDIVKGSAKLNLLLVAQLFNARPRIRELSPHEVKLLVEAAESTGNAEMVDDLHAYSITRQASARSASASSVETTRHRTGGRSASGMMDLAGFMELDPETEVPGSEEEPLIYDVDENIPRCIFCGFSWGGHGGTASRRGSENDLENGPEESAGDSGVANGGNGEEVRRDSLVKRQQKPQEQEHPQRKPQPQQPQTQRAERRRNRAAGAAGASDSGDTDLCIVS